MFKRVVQRITLARFFLRHSVVAYYSWGVHGEGPQMTVGWSEPAIFGNFGWHILRTFKLKASVIMQHHEVLKRLSLNDPEMALCARTCFHQRFD